MVNNFDIDPFIVGLLAPTSVTAPAAYLAVGADQVCWERRTRWGDANHDGAVNNVDIDPFIACMIADDPTVACQRVARSDANCDGFVNYRDIAPFIQAHVVGDCACFDAGPACYQHRCVWLDANGDGSCSNGFDRAAFLGCFFMAPPPDAACPPEW